MTGSAPVGARVTPGRPSIWDRLSEQRWLHHVLRWVRVYQVSGAVLHRVPLRRRLRGSRMRYRISSLDQLGLQAEIFGRDGYAAALAGAPSPRTVIDLGANAGWFDVWLAHHNRSRAFRSLLIEADPRLVEEARWHIAVNRLNARVVHGAAGVIGTEPTVSFFVSPSASQSSLRVNESTLRLPAKGVHREVRVPAVSVEAEWKRWYGDVAVDLLKVDIEGAEADFFEVEGDFVAGNVSRIVVEWDKWTTSGDALERRLAVLGFIRIGSVKEDRRTGLAVYQRR